MKLREEVEVALQKLAKLSNDNTQYSFMPEAENTAIPKKKENNGEYYYLPFQF